MMKKGKLLIVNESEIERCVRLVVNEKDGIKIFYLPPLFLFLVKTQILFFFLISL